MIQMPDSITPSNLPPGCAAYLGYADGNWPTAATLRVLFPGAHIVSLTVTGAVLGADGCDIENGDLSPSSGAGWAARKLALQPGSRPVLYASASAMDGVLAELAAEGITPGQVRLFSAHYGAGEHLCGPLSCRLTPRTMDATQWTDQAPGLNGSTIDMSVVADDFFGLPAPPATVNWTEFDMSKLRVLRQGDRDVPGSFFWVVRLQDELRRAGELNGIAEARDLAPDGDFGPKTDAAVRAVQAHYRIGVDGVAGAQTRSVLLTGAP